MVVVCYDFRVDLKASGMSISRQPKHIQFGERPFIVSP